MCALGNGNEISATLSVIVGHGLRVGIFGKPIPLWLIV